ncbi:hypothetical protein [Flavobacterium cerinum]|uniref:DUF1828 domain-containing protein n=1 Tax=Flavobacterium cerinum TaxID=2502784 RepID=A0ABY5INY8_9FLAO|nr:hypothetical protein [Flavobacterium cerinum]UUC43940.1 hypothetical protein NOX80_09865 [Flavobacterium cerinum]
MENQVYNWFVKNGNILIQKNGDCILLQLDYENGDSCLLTATDNEEIIELLTKIAKQIWEDPNYVRKPYAGQLCKENNNEYSWEIEGSELLIKYNTAENAVEINRDGNKTLNLEINYLVEIIQILEHFNR